MSLRWGRHDWVPDVELPLSANEDDSWDLLLKLANEAQDIAEHVNETLPDIDDLPPGAEREALLERTLMDLLAANDRAVASLRIAASVAAKLSTSAKARPVRPSARALAREMFLREVSTAKETAYHIQIAAFAVGRDFIDRAEALWPKATTTEGLQRTIENFASRHTWKLPDDPDGLIATPDRR
jgi:hypothetical protein